MRLSDLPTPAAVVDLDLLRANCAAMRARAGSLGVRLRPHVKTHKCVEIARLQTDGADGITVSTLAEAHHMAAGGFTDITWALPVPHPRIGEAVALHDRLASQGGRLQLLVDHESTVAALSRAAAARRLALPVLLKVDCGYGRAGVDPEAIASAELAHRIANSPGLALRGLLTHAGHSYDAVGAPAVRAIARRERDAVVGFAGRLRAEGLMIDEVSVGSTPTIALGEDLTGCTEARPGNYALFDLTQARIGSCQVEDIALSVIVSVIGVYPDRLRAVIDGGALAFSKDPGPGDGYGRVCTLDGAPLPLRLVSLSQEHGTLVADTPQALASLTPGARLRVLPNHSCLVTALHGELAVAQGSQVVDRWRPARLW